MDTRMRESSPVLTGRMHAEEGDMPSMNFHGKLELMSSAFIHAQPSLHGGLSEPAKPFAWSRLEQDSAMTTNSIYGRGGDKSENTTNAVKWNQGGSKLIAGGRDNIIRLYDVDSNVRCLQDYRQHTGSIISLAFDNPENENVFASTSKDNSFRVWDVRKPKQPVHIERTKEEIIRGIFSPGQAVGCENLFATCNYNDEINFYDTRMWRMVKQIKSKSEVENFIWDRSGSVLFVTDFVGNIGVFDGQALRASPETTLSGIHRKVSKCTSIHMHPSNEIFVTGGNDSIIAFWDFEELLCTGTIMDNDYPVR